MKSIRTKYFMEKCFAGLNFLAIALLWYSLEQEWNLWWAYVIAGAIILGYFIFTCFLNSKIHYEPVDEMTKMHEYKAQAATYNAFCVLLALFGVLCLLNKTMRSLVFSFQLSWTYLFLVLGILHVVEYLLFLKIESSGDVID